MAWSGGTYRKGNYSTNGWTGDASLGVGIEAGRHDTQDDDFMNGINNCIAKDGSNSATGNLNIGSNRITNIAAATARTDAAQVGQVQDGDYIWLGTTGGTATAMTASASPPITAYKAGQKFRMLAGTASTGTNITAHSLNINGLGARSIKTSQGSIDLTVGDWAIGGLIELVYDGSTFRLNNASGGWASWSPTLTPQNGTASSVVFNPAIYQKFSRICHLQCVATWTQNTATANFIDVTLPIAGFYNNQTLTAVGFSLSNIVAAQSFITGSGLTLRIYNYNQQVWNIGANQLFFGGTYMTA